MRSILTKIRAQKGSVPIFCILAALLFFLIFSRMAAALLLQHQTKAQAAPFVRTLRAQAIQSTEEIILPGTIRAWHEAPIYARVNGYIKRWYVDIGSKVDKGDLLAMIDAPELDAQYRQAEAEYNVALANFELAEVSAKRWLHLVKTGSVSKQETDEKVDTAKALHAVVNAKRANLDHLRELIGFKKIKAPFSGIISDRRTDIGNLINSGSLPKAAEPLFRIAQHNPLRMYIKLPETYAPRIKSNLRIQLALSEYPGVLFTAQLLQTAEAIEPKTRTLLCEFTIENTKHLLLPGAYAQVHIIIPGITNAVQLPATALLFRSQGLQIATLNKNNRVVLKKISLHRDNGETVEVSTGIVPGEIIINYPSDSIFNHQLVRPIASHSSHAVKK